MTANTARGYPYPQEADPYAGGNEAIQALAQAVDTKLGVMDAGNVSITVPAGGSGNIAVTFRAGRFTAAPYVLIQALTSTPQLNWVAVDNITVTGFRALGYRQSTVGPTLTNWMAVQV